MSAIDWACKKISPKSASGQLSAITISCQQLLPSKLDACANVTTCCFLHVTSFEQPGPGTVKKQTGNFHAPGENRTRDPPVQCRADKGYPLSSLVQWLARPVFIVFAGSWVRFSPGVGKFSLPRASMVSLPFKLKMFTGSVCAAH